jgi:hypothetical protein
MNRALFFLILLFLVVGFQGQFGPSQEPENKEEEEIMYVPRPPHQEVGGFGAMVESEGEGQSGVEKRIRYYQVGGGHRTGASSGTMQNVVDPTPFQTFTDIDKENSFTHVHVWASIGFVGISTSQYIFDVEVDGAPINTLGACLSSSVSIVSDGASTNPSRGHGYSELRCTIPLQQEEFNLDFVVGESTQNLNRRVGFTVYNTEVYNHTLPTPSIHPAIESGRYYKDAREHTHYYDHVLTTGATFTVSRNLLDHLDSHLVLNESESTLRIDYTIMIHGSPGAQAPEITFSIPGQNFTAPCKIRVSGEPGGTAIGGSLNCRLENHVRGFIEINGEITDPDNLIDEGAFSMAIHQKETRLVPLMPDTMSVTSTDLAFWLPLLFFGLLLFWALTTNRWAMAVVLSLGALAQLITIPWGTTVTLIIVFFQFWWYRFHPPRTEDDPDPTLDPTE